MALSKIETSSLDIGPIGGRRNVVINGSFSVNQRGQISSSAFAVSSDRYIIDRWFFRKSNGTSNSVTLLSDQSVTGLGVSNVLKIQNFNDSAWVGQYVEIAANTFLSGQEVTVSYYAKADSTFSGLSVFLHDNFDGGNHGNPYFTQSQTVSTSWERYSHTMTIGDLANDDSRGYLNLGFGQADTNATIYLAGIQLELGDTATPFEHESYGTTLQRCQRYAIMYSGLDAGKGGIVASGTRGFFGFGSAHNANNPVTFLSLPVVMRAAPTLSYSSAGHFAFDTGYGVFAVYTNLQTQNFRANPQSIALIGTTSGLSNGNAGSLSTNNSTGWILLDAEL